MFILEYETTLKAFRQPEQQKNACDLKFSLKNLSEDIELLRDYTIFNITCDRSI